MAPFSLGLTCSSGPGPWEDLLGPGQGGVEPGGSFLLAIGRGCPAVPQLWSLCAVQGAMSPGCLGCCAFCLHGHGANISFPCNLFFVLILYTV